MNRWLQMSTKWLFKYNHLNLCYPAQIFIIVIMDLSLTHSLTRVCAELIVQLYYHVHLECFPAAIMSWIKKMTDNHGYVPFAVVTSCTTYYRMWLITGGLKWVTQQMTLVEPSGAPEFTHGLCVVYCVQ